MAVITVDHEEMDGYPKERRTMLRFEATRKVKCTWDDRITLAEEATEYPGHEYPYETSTQSGLRNAIRCVSATTEGFTGMDGSGGTESVNALAFYAHALVTLLYETPSRNSPIAAGSAAGAPPAGDPRTTSKIVETFDPTFENVRLPADDFVWGDADNTPLKPDEAPSKIISGDEYVFRILNATIIPPAAFSLKGHVNAAAVVTGLARRTFAPETMLFVGASLERTADVLGRGERIDAVYRFIHNPNGWNKFARAIGSGGITNFQEIFLKTVSPAPIGTSTSALTAHKIYPTGNFAEFTF